MVQIMESLSQPIERAVCHSDPPGLPFPQSHGRKHPSQPQPIICFSHPPVAPRSGSGEDHPPSSLVPAVQHLGEPRLAKISFLNVAIPFRAAQRGGRAPSPSISPPHGPKATERSKSFWGQRGTPKECPTARTELSFPGPPSSGRNVFLTIYLSSPNPSPLS